MDCNNVMQTIKNFIMYIFYIILLILNIVYIKCFITISVILD